MRPASGETIILHPPGVLLYHSHALFFRQAKNRAVNALPNLRAKPNLQRFVLCQRIPNRLRHLFLIAVAEQPLFIRRILSAGDVTGAVAFLENDEHAALNETQKSLIQAASQFLGKQLED